MSQMARVALFQSWFGDNQNEKPEIVLLNQHQDDLLIFFYDDISGDVDILIKDSVLEKRVEDEIDGHFVFWIVEINGDVDYVFIGDYCLWPKGGDEN